MNNRTKILFGMVLAMFLVAPTIVAVSAQGMMDPGERHMPDPRRDDSGTVWVNTDVITVMANSEIPMFHFWYTADANGSMSKFSITYSMISEFEDSNGDNAYQTDEALYFAPLAAYEWTVQTGSESVDGVTTEIWLKYIKGGARTERMTRAAPTMMDPGDGDISRFEDVSIQIWAHLYLNDYEGNVTDDHGVQAEYTVEGTSELKMDIEISNFPFSSKTSSVALQTMLHENEATDPMRNMHRFMVRERTRNTTVGSEDNWTTTGGNETRFEAMNDRCVQQIDFVDGSTSEATGFFSWLDIATITWPGGATEAVNVTASYVPTGMGLAVNLAYPNFDDGTLLHDPSIGLDESSAPLSPLTVEQTILLGIGIIAVIAIVVVAIKRR